MLYDGWFSSSTNSVGPPSPPGKAITPAPRGAGDFYQFLSFSGHPERSNKGAILGKAEISTFTACREQRARGISTEARKPRARCEHAELLYTKCYFASLDCNAFA